MPGPPPKPKKLKELEGNPSKRPLNETEPEPDIDIPDCPDFLQGPAREEWFRITPELKTCGLISRIDRAALTAYCQTWGMYVDACEKLEALRMEGSDVYTSETANGNIIQNPIIGVINKAALNCHKFLIEFGMTPASRSRIDVSKADNPGDEMERLMEDSWREHKGE